MSGFKPIARGPQIGAPPSLENIPVDRLQVDPAYQRATDGARSRRIIVGMVKEWNWALCQPLVVARREDGSLWILDGQHRHAGARERADIQYLPCFVLAGLLGVEREAETFVGLNTRRQALSQFDRFAGMLAAGDETAAEVAALIESTGWRIMRGNAQANTAPGTLSCAPSLVGLSKRFGEPTMRDTLVAIRSAWPAVRVGPIARMIEAVATVIRNRGGEPRGLSGALARRTPEEWLAASTRLRAERPGLPWVVALAAAIDRELGAAPVVPKTAGGGCCAHPESAAAANRAAPDPHRRAIPARARRGRGVRRIGQGLVQPVRPTRRPQHRRGVQVGPLLSARSRARCGGGGLG